MAVPGPDDFTETRAAFADAATWFGRTVRELDLAPDEWNAPALGEWSRRDLVGHTSRALLTVEQYLDGGPSSSSQRTIDYFRAVRSGRSDPDEVAERGRRAADELGDRLPDAVDGIVERVIDLVSQQRADTRVSTPIGEWTLATYLPTRVFELVVHTLDLRRAAGIDDALPTGPGRAALAVLGSLVADAAVDDAPTLLASLTGRAAWPAGRSIL